MSLFSLQQKKLGLQRGCGGQNAKAKLILGIDEAEVTHAKRCNEKRKEQVSYAAHKRKKLSKLLGIPDDDVLDAVRDSSISNSGNISATWHGNCGTSFDEPIKWTTLVDGVVVITLVGVLFYALQVSTEGTFGRMVAGIFPREMEAIGLKSFLERVR